MTTVIVDYGSGNLRSAEKAFQRMSVETNGGDIIVTSRADLVATADRIVLPGVGAFADCKRGLLAVDGMFDAIQHKVFGGAPFLASRGMEHGETSGFDWIAGDVVRLGPSDSALKVPHMGWNNLGEVADHPVLSGISSGDHAYFVHSYHMAVSDVSHRMANVDYAQEVTAAVGRDNMFGTQFHPEKSQQTGLRLIANFLHWKP